jgi:phosphate transport system permease protein
LKLKGDWVARKVFFVAAMMVVLGILLIIVLVTKEAVPALTKIGPFKILFSSKWEPSKNQYGILVFIVGTLLTTLGALIIGVPLAIGIALFVTEVAPKKAAGVVSNAIELLAGVPSIVIGWLGLTALIPLLKSLTGKATAFGLLPASIVLAVMVIPTICAISVDAINSVPDAYKQGSVGLGATRWQTMRHVTLPAAKSGLVVATILGMGRAIGETVAVALVIGTANVFPTSLLSPTNTLTTKIFTDIQESSGIQHSVLFVMGVVLLLIAVGLILIVRKVAPPITKVS